MTSAEPVRPAASYAREVRPSVLAALQLVEDAHQLGNERRSRQGRRLLAERTVAYRKLTRDPAAG